jgi:pyruvate dehydrogenase E2 component (dihydrolipoamide acetyltransferase)
MISGRITASPRARRSMREQGIDPTLVRGSGPGGRIVVADLANSRPAGTTSTMRRAIARRTAESAATIPHFYLRAEVDAQALMRCRNDVLAALQPNAVRPTVGDFLLRAQMLALSAYPRANQVWRDDELVALSAASVGLVVGLDDGLVIAPIAPAATLAELSAERLRKVTDARAGKINSSPCATSLSNIGNGRVDEFQAIIPLGQSSILAVGRAAPRPIAVGDALAVRTTLRLTLSVDHRVLDGQPAAEFLERIVEALENPGKLL